MFALNWLTGYILGLIFIVGTLFFVAAKLGVTLFIALLLVLLLQPIKKRLERKFSPGVASFLALILLLGSAAILISWILNQMLPGFKQFASTVPHLVNQQTLGAWLVSLNLPPEIMEYTNHLLNNATEFAVTAVKSSLVPAVQALSGVVELIGVPFIVFYLLKDGDKLLNMIISFVPLHERARIASFFGDAAFVLGGYIKGQLAVCLVSGITVLIFFMIAGLPHVPVFAAISAVGELIPVIGPLTSSVLAIAIALLLSPSLAIKVAVFYFIMFKINHNIIYPNLVGKALCLHPVVIMIGLLLFGHLFGVLGMMLAVPTMGILRIILKYVLPTFPDPATNNTTDEIKRIGDESTCE
ncbi:AI-2E family transporter [Sporomusa sp.]|uniref:AI-2E family transporter n=1 Tax=Sporomusa sp. TaxID=2078658 RepID=UPI002CB2DE37|nr:AI-2E family transporter [Sporomusa sp.]HWR45656.1 AI-2E family transporter [Sporomusa sp.]